MNNVLEFCKNLYRPFMIIWFILMFFIILCKWTSKIRFGHGLGDVYYFFLMIAVILSVGILYTIRLKSIIDFHVKKIDLIIGFFCLVFLIYILLKISFLRGNESSWDGTIFF